jgi:AcrR family transcriptional regulator
MGVGRARGKDELRERKRRDLRQRILEAALFLVQERGYEETVLSDVAEAAEIAEATLYRYFSSKEDLLAEISAALMGELVLAVILLPTIWLSEPGSDR